MKKAYKYLGVFAFSLITIMLISGCSSTRNVSRTYYGDDMYETHDRVAIANAERRQAEINKAEAEARKARIEAMKAQAEADAALDDLLVLNDVDVYYEDIYVGDYSSAYERRLRAFSSSTYDMPDAYYTYHYNSSYMKALAYNPSFYNVIIMGDQIWVEPTYVTNMFGWWGRPSWYLSLIHI